MRHIPSALATVKLDHKASCILEKSRPEIPTKQDFSSHLLSTKVSSIWYFMT
ncbi:hypothetical protein Csa_007269, partial [Cucumis sativus]